ncbi:MAG: transcriptional coactivator p15/PC4 family protein [Candidatus Hydrogenedentota bacterium]
MPGFEKQVVINVDSKNPIVLRQSEFNEKRGIDIRRFFYTDANEMKPTKKGIWLGLNQCRQVLKSLEELLPAE